jgi:ferredoxin
MRVQIDRSKCQGHAMCEMASGGFFELDDLGHIASTDGDVGAGNEAAALSGADACPERVITTQP